MSIKSITIDIFRDKIFLRKASMITLPVTMQVH